MTIDEAIRILEHKISQNVFQVDPDALTALKLGIEALKRIKETRLTGVWAGRENLAGETEI